MSSLSRCNAPCPSPASHTGDLYFPAWEIRKNETSLRAMAPCQSLGAYYVRPTPPVVKFLAKLSDWVVNTHTQQWDQAAWNEVRPVLRQRCRPLPCG